jgi:hypothetical protein
MATSTRRPRIVAAIRPPYPKLVDVRVEELRPAVKAEQQDRDESDWRR